MKNILVILFLFNFCIVGNSFGQKPSASDKEKIENLVIKSFDEIFSGLDKAKINTFFTEDFILLEDGLVWNNDSIAAHVDRTKARIAEKNITVNRVNKMDFIEVKIKDNMAWVAYNNHAVYNDGKGKTYGEDKWLESAVAIRTHDGWKIQMLHSTPKK